MRPAGGTQKHAEAAQPRATPAAQTPKGSWVGTGTSALQQAWSFVTDEAAAVAAEGPDGVDRAAQHHVPMPKPYLHFNIHLHGALFLLISGLGMQHMLPQPSFFIDAMCICTKSRIF